jgi:peptidoglycan hydrolase-like protein with peptidoglycan-binding domain
MTTRTTFKASRLLSVAAVALLAAVPAYAATGSQAKMGEGMHGTMSATAKAPKMATTEQNMAKQKMAKSEMAKPKMAGPMKAKEVEMSAMPKARLPRRAEVMGVQNALNAKGYALTADGIFGKHTRAALRKYQKANGLKVTGRIDKATLRSLNIS